MRPWLRPLEPLALAGAMMLGLCLLGLGPAVGGGRAMAQTLPPQVCVDVINDTDYWMPGALESADHDPVGFHFEARHTTRACMRDLLLPGTILKVVIKSGWGLPIGTCRLQSGGAMRIVRRPDASGTDQTDLICP